MIKNYALRFVSPDGKESLTIRRSIGKKGTISVRASHKKPGAKKAVAGCRSTHDNAESANAAVDVLRSTTLQRGWKEDERQTTKRESFSEIPLAPGLKAVK